MKFSTRHTDMEVQRIQQEVEDNLADRDDLAAKADRVSTIIKVAPRLTDMADGDIIYYTDGTSDYRYTRVSSRLYIERMSQDYTAGTGILLSGGSGSSSLTIDAGNAIDQSEAFAFFTGS